MGLSPQVGGNGYSEHGLSWSFSQSRQNDILPTRAFLRNFLLPVHTFGPLPARPRTLLLALLLPSLSSSLPGREDAYILSLPFLPTHSSSLTTCWLLPPHHRLLSRSQKGHQWPPPNSLSSTVIYSHPDEAFESAPTLFSLNGLDSGSSWVFPLSLPFNVPQTTPVLCQQLCQGTLGQDQGRSLPEHLAHNYWAIPSSQTRRGQHDQKGTEGRN